MIRTDLPQEPSIVDPEAPYFDCDRCGAKAIPTYVGRYVKADGTDECHACAELDTRAPSGGAEAAE